jgi:hypothetical protein
VPEVTVGPKQVPVTKSNKIAKLLKALPIKQKELVVTMQSTIEISDLLYILFNACVELTRRLLTSVSILPSEPPRSWTMLKIFVLFVVEYSSTASTDDVRWPAGMPTVSAAGSKSWITSSGKT